MLFAILNFLVFNDSESDSLRLSDATHICRLMSNLLRDGNDISLPLLNSSSEIISLPIGCQLASLVDNRLRPTLHSNIPHPRTWFSS
ncbi:hypothetical protein C8R42DRAFT_359969 [Lentinula raphanica]|nr:hypothetical protein C8R42DRAFT_359969 [Lentinula raphanica]